MTNDRSVIDLPLTSTGVAGDGGQSPNVQSTGARGTKYVSAPGLDRMLARIRKQSRLDVDGQEDESEAGFRS